mgnify:CR=1 FL=1|jgi:L-ribulose-5-phosphate 3-epimerase UlaE
MSNEIGVMQGRLLPKYLGRYQAHPVDYWQDEFNFAKQLNLDCIEFILDFDDVEKNPLIKDGGIDEIKIVEEKTGVQVRTICADYFMEAPLHSENDEISYLSKNLLVKLLKNSSSLGVKDIVIPCVDQSSLKSQKVQDRFIEKLLPIEEIAEKYGINLSLETDLDPQSFSKLLERFQSNRITVNYDIGNSAALGYRVSEELECYGHQITDIHIKDRLLGGGPIILGSGNANFPEFFKTLKNFDYKGPFIMQAYRDDEGVDIFKKQLEWIKQYI